MPLNKGNDCATLQKVTRCTKIFLQNGGLEDMKWYNIINWHVCGDKERIHVTQYTNYAYE